MSVTVTYLFDPLCGWCYGAAPAIGRIAAMPDMTLRLAPTGLFAGAGASVTSAGFVSHVREADVRISELSGQPFSDAYRDRILQPGQPIDSGPATLALTAVAQTAPDRELDALRAIQSARYVGGRDITDTTVLVDVLRDIALDAAADRLADSDPALIDANAARIDEARGLLDATGRQGVPTIVASRGTTAWLVDSNVLFGPPDALASALAAR